MSDFYVRDEFGRFAGRATAGPAARSFSGFFQELKARPSSPSGKVLIRQQDGTAAVIEVVAGHVNWPTPTA